MRGSVLYLPPNRIPRMHNFEFLALNDFGFIKPLNL